MLLQNTSYYFFIVLSYGSLVKGDIHPLLFYISAMWTAHCMQLKEKNGGHGKKRGRRKSWTWNMELTLSLVEGWVVA